ncbi:putative DD34D transposase [Trichonephila clavipes]|nr:putative DD34D transposase [Trichonephila clavipes]
MVTGDEKWVTYYNIVRKRSWSKCGEATQTVAKPELTARKVLLCIWWDSRADLRDKTSRVNIHQKKVMPSVRWDFKGISNFLAFTGQQNDYCHQQDTLNDSFGQKRSELNRRKGIDQDLL